MKPKQFKEKLAALGNEIFSNVDLEKEKNLRSVDLQTELEISTSPTREKASAMMETFKTGYRAINIDLPVSVFSFFFEEARDAGLIERSTSDIKTIKKKITELKKKKEKNKTDKLLIEALEKILAEKLEKFELPVESCNKDLQRKFVLKVMSLISDDAKIVADQLIAEGAHQKRNLNYRKPERRFTDYIRYLKKNKSFLEIEKEKLEMIEKAISRFEKGIEKSRKKR